MVAFVSFKEEELPMEGSEPLKRRHVRNIFEDSFTVLPVPEEPHNDDKQSSFSEFFTQILCSTSGW